MKFQKTTIIPDTLATIGKVFDKLEQIPTLICPNNPSFVQALSSVENEEDELSSLLTTSFVSTKSTVTDESYTPTSCTNNSLLMSTSTTGFDEESPTLCSTPLSSVSFTFGNEANNDQFGQTQVSQPPYYQTGQQPYAVTEPPPTQQYYYPQTTTAQPYTTTASPYYQAGPITQPPQQQYYYTQPQTTTAQPVYGVSPQAFYYPQQQVPTVTGVGSPYYGGIPTTSYPPGGVTVSPYPVVG